GVGENPPAPFWAGPAASGSRASLLVRDLATQMPAPTANTRIRTIRTCTRAGSARAQDCGRSRSLDTWLRTSVATPLSAYIRLIYWRHTFLPQTYDAWVNGAGTPNNFAVAIMKKVVALRQTEKPPTPVMVKAFLGLCRLRVRPE